MYTITNLSFVCRPALKYNWFENKFVPLSFFILWAKGSWVSGVIGDPSNLLPNSQKVKSARTCFHIVTICNNTLDTRVVVFMVEEEVDSRKRNNAKPLALATVLTWYAGEWKANRVTPV